ncbi:MAG: hypothetical protein IPJ27_14100 [Candidatus Accumulibacter sp.]|uniref:Uncharacterized protein n=1 Tax=Candidatus Accumulibacter proximus TaxID=2954385 RepID=A0A935UGL2_9PROT|nr:hypothetical protein [Candidatus Accumulibacter proximus]
MEDLQPGWLSTGAQRWAYLIGLSLVLGLLIGSANIAYWSTSALTPGEGGLNYGEIIGSISFSIETVESARLVTGNRLAGRVARTVEAGWRSGPSRSCRQSRSVTRRS